MKSRILQMMRNGAIGVLCQIVVLIMNFITRRIFLEHLSITYLGYNGLFTNILGALNLAELGVGTALTYKFYKPIAEHNSEQVSILLAVYKKIYNRIGYFVLIAGGLISPFVPYFIKDSSGSNKQYIILLFIIQLLGTATTYFFSYKRTIFFASQRDYVCSTADMVANLLFSIIKILFIILFENYLIYLVLQVLQNYASNFYISCKCKKQYPEYQLPENRGMEIKNKIANTRIDVYKNIKNVFLGKFAIYIFISTDNILISKFVGITSVGLLSNYSLITSTITTFINKLLDPVQAGFGNLLNNKSEENRCEQLYYNFQFLQCFIGIMVASGVATLINPMIGLYFGDQYCMNYSIVIILSINLYLDILQRPSCNYINALGLFNYDKVISLVGALTNIILSLIFVQYLGVIGVLLGTTFSQILFLIFRSYYVVCRYMKTKLFRFYIIICEFTLIGILITGIFGKIVSLIKFNYFTLLFTALGCIISDMIIVAVLFRKTEEFRYFLNVVKRFKNNAIRVVGRE